MAVSACFISVSTSSPSCGKSAMPILPDVNVSDLSLSRTGFDIAARIFLDILSTTEISVTSFRIMMNSSPPSRETISESLIVFLRRIAISLSNSSPALCPKVSLMSLNLSRSINNTAICVSFRFEIFKFWANWFIHILRFGKSVNAS